MSLTVFDGPILVMNARAIAEAHDKDGANVIYGMAALVRHVYEGRDISPLWNDLWERVSANQTDAAAFLDLSTILYAIGQKDKAALVQKAALGNGRTFEVPHGEATGLRVLAFVTGGDFMANTPIDFLLESSDTVLLLHYVDGTTSNLDDVPPHDVAFVAVGESEANVPVLENLERLLADWRTPIVNRAPGCILALTRDGVVAALAGEPSILAPATARVTREALLKLAAGDIELGSLLPDGSYPVIVRPFGTHAGGGLEKIADRAELAAYMQGRGEATFYVAPFVDYRSPDGKFRKQRIAVIDGKAFASHLAISDHWMVHYLSAGMAAHADRRAEEAQWMRDFDSDFAVRHANAFAALHRRLGLDYFAIDCAELPDGRLLVFEADVAMIVHAMDSEAAFPYKKLPMANLFDAFERMLARRITDRPALRGEALRRAD